MKQVLLLTLPLVATLSIFLFRVHVNMYCIHVTEIAFHILTGCLWDFLCCSIPFLYTGVGVTHGPWWLEFSFCFFKCSVFLSRYDQVDTEKEEDSVSSEGFASFAFFWIKEQGWRSFLKHVCCALSWELADFLNNLCHSCQWSWGTMPISEAGSSILTGCWGTGNPYQSDRVHSCGQKLS